ncbi:BA3454 family stress response protein [Bacillus sp. ISL-47]|nr:BA3454 family stress response protein [Bacillus sp. ISL-47]MBT2687680.1 BA3454 family stress response protein [Bacillus sp. ISL-47]MBT2707445.1 BA3454 family stress response protein [Pseudomonas sp. ISL-84]
MKEITVTIDYDGMKYQTNIITNKEARDEEIMKQAEDQVRKQWAG